MYNVPFSVVTDGQAVSYQVLARKWRPRNFQEMKGQGHVVQALANALDSNRLHHAFLFTGTRGVGKTTLARVLAKCLNCEQGVGSAPCGACSSCTEIDQGRSMDLLEVDAASRSRVDETRELMDNVQFAPSRCRYKVYLIDEVHMFSDKSFNALLKTLEEPPEHVKFLLATTDPRKLPITVLSRCLQFNLKRLPADLIDEHLSSILEKEQIKADAGASRLLAHAADGSMRDALSLLDQAIAYGGGELKRKEVGVMLGTVDAHHSIGLLQALADKDGAALLEKISHMAAEAVDFSQALSQLLGCLHRLATRQVVPEGVDGGPEEEQDLARLAQCISREDVQLYYQIGLLSRRDLPLAPDPRVGFEMAALRMLAFTPDSAPPDSSPGTASGEGGTRIKTGPIKSNPIKTNPIKTNPGLQTAASAPASPAARKPANANRQSTAPANSPVMPDVTETAEPANGAIDEASWPRVVEAMELNGLTRQLALHCRVTSAAPGGLCLELAPNHQQLLAPRVKDKLEAALENHRGAKLKLSIRIASPDGSNDPNGDTLGNTPAQLQDRNRQERHRTAVSAIENDPQVQAICNTFDARVDESQVRPVDN